MGVHHRISYDFSADRKGKILTHMQDLPLLKHCIFEHPYNVDVFSPLEKLSVESIEIFAATGKSFPIEKIKRITTLKSIAINNVAVELNCEIFKDLGHLEELSLMNINNVTNVGALLELERLQRLSIRYCKNAINSSDKELFQKRDFSYLKIE
jgi:hypothetical protein